MSPLDRKNELRPINEDYRRRINASKDNNAQPKKVAIDFRNELSANVVRPIYQIPSELIRFRKNNGRIASDVLTYESVHGEIDEATDAGQDQIGVFLDDKHSGYDNILYDSLKHVGQREPAIITCDGFLINGNRRKMTLDKLSSKHKNKARFKFLRAVILPGPGDPGGPPTLLEIEQVENRLQLMKSGKAEYKGFDHALSIRRKKDIGMSLEEQVRDDPAHHAKKSVKRQIEKLKKDFLKPLECIERYLLHFDRSSSYNLVANRWQAFLDYSNFYNYTLKVDKKRIDYFDGKVGEEDIPTVEDIAFKMIRKGTFRKDATKDKLHVLMRDLKNIFKDDDSRETIKKIADDDIIPHDLTKEEIDELEDKNSLRERDRAWQIKTDQKFTELIRTAQLYSDQNKENLNPLMHIKAIISKLDKIQFSDKLEVLEAKEYYKEFRKASNKLDDLMNDLDGMRQERD